MKSSAATDTFSTRDAAKILGVSVRTAQIWVEEGRLRAWKTPGGHRRILRESVEAILRKRERESTGLVDGFDVLVIDDNPNQRQMLESKLIGVQPGLSVRVASNGTEGLIKIGERQPQLLITNLVVPGVDGFQILSTLATSAFRKPMQIIAISELHDGAIAERGGVPPGVALFRKPLNVAALLNLVLAYHDLWSLQRQSSR